MNNDCFIIVERKGANGVRFPLRLVNLAWIYKKERILSDCTVAFRESVCPSMKVSVCPNNVRKKKRGKMGRIVKQQPIRW